MTTGYSSRIVAITVAAMLVPCAAGAAQQPATTPAEPLGFGTPVTPAELSRFFSIPPDGEGLPDGQGTPAEGATTFATHCAMCHGAQLQGIPATGAPKLIGGRGTLTKVPAVKTVESYWPYATTLFDYIKRAMPLFAPGSLTNDEVYALSAYILSEAHIVPKDAVMNKVTLPKVEMPNRLGFKPFPGPPRQFYEKAPEHRQDTPE